MGFILKLFEDPGFQAVRATFLEAGFETDLYLAQDVKFFAVILIPLFLMVA